MLFLLGIRLEEAGKAYERLQDPDLPESVLVYGDSKENLRKTVNALLDEVWLVCS